VISDDLGHRFPPQWRQVRVAEAGEVIVGQQKARPDSEGEVLPYLRVANVQDGLLEFSDLNRMPVKDPERYRLEPGDVLLCEGQSRELVGRAAMYEGGLVNLMFQNSLLRFRSGPDVEPRFALLVFRCYQKSGVFSSVAKATTGMAHLSLSRLKALPFPLPPREVQIEIVSRAEAIQVSLDSLLLAIRNTEAHAAQLLPAAADVAILGMSDLERPDEGDQKRGIRASWPMLPVADLVADDSPIVYGILQPGPEHPDGIPYIRGQDLRQWGIARENLRRTSPATASRYPKSTLQAGDVLLGIIRQTRVAVVPDDLDGAQITQGTAVLRPGPRVRSMFLAHWLSSASAQFWLRGKLRGIDMPGLNLRDVRSLPTPAPPLEEQDRIVADLERLRSEIAEIATVAKTCAMQTVQLETQSLSSLLIGEAAQSLTARASPLQVDSASRSSPSSRSDTDDLTEWGAGTEPSNHQSARDAKGGGSDVTSTYRVTQKGAVTTTASEVEKALKNAGAAVSPEELFTAIGLAESAVDSFYVSLRQLVRDKRVLVSRPTSDSVRLSITTP
jgi:type I restriction enzyme S subunit